MHDCHEYVLIMHIRDSRACDITNMHTQYIFERDSRAYRAFRMHDGHKYALITHIRDNLAYRAYRAEPALWSTWSTGRVDASHLRF